MSAAEKIHAGRINAPGTPALCGETEARITRPKETVTCGACRLVITHIRATYPMHAGYGDWRLTRAQKREAARAMAADLYGGADD